MMDWVKKALRSSRSSSPNQPSPPEVLPQSIVPWSASRASWLLVKPATELESDDKQALARMKQEEEKIADAYSLAQCFISMVRERCFEALLPWLEEVKKSGIEGLKRFAKGIKQDYDAVLNALRYEWSNGQVEGQVNRLKLIKRQMYGRANFDLLRKRVLFNPITVFG